MSQPLSPKARNLRVIRIDDNASAPVPPERYSKIEGACFELTRVAEPWKLTRGGLPQIGALIAECGDVGEAATAAEEALRMLPLGEGAPKCQRPTVEIRSHRASSLL